MSQAQVQAQDWLGSHPGTNPVPETVTKIILLTLAYYLNGDFIEDAMGFKRSSRPA